MKSTITTGLLLLILFITFSSSAAPRKRRGRFVPGWTINLSAGSTLFYGEIKQNSVIPLFKFKNEVRASGSLTLSRRIKPYLNVNYQFLLGQLAGTHRGTAAKYDQFNDSYFRSNILENNLNIKLYIPELLNPRKSSSFTYYVTAGFGLTRFRSIRYAMWIKNNPILSATGYDMQGNKTNPEVATVIPIGFGLEYNVSNKVSINLEYSRRFINTDKLDATVHNSKNDQYDFTSLGITYYFKGMYRSVGGGGQRGSSNKAYLKKHKHYVPHYRY